MKLSTTTDPSSPSWLEKEVKIIFSLSLLMNTTLVSIWFITSWDEKTFCFHFESLSSCPSHSTNILRLIIFSFPTRLKFEFLWLLNDWPQRNDLYALYTLCTNKANFSAIYNSLLFAHHCEGQMSFFAQQKAPSPCKKTRGGNNAFSI